MKPAETENAPVRAMTTAELAEHARAARRLGIDTEFVSESRYRALLGLVQVVVKTENGQHIELLDPLADFDHEPLAAVWGDPEVEVVIHSGAQDVAILRRAWGVAPRNLFDTPIAAGVAGFSAQAGYREPLPGALGARARRGGGCPRPGRRAPTWGAPRPATGTCSRRRSGCGSRSRPGSRAGTGGRSRRSSSTTRARTSRTCSRSPTTCSGDCVRPAGSNGRARSAGGSRT